MLMCVMLMYSYKCVGPKLEKMFMDIFLLFNGNMLKSRDFPGLNKSNPGIQFSVILLIPTLTEISGSLKHSCAGQRRKRVNLRDYAGQVGIVLQ